MKLMSMAFAAFVFLWIIYIMPGRCINPAQDIAYELDRTPLRSYRNATALNSKPFSYPCTSCL